MPHLAGLYYEEHGSGPPLILSSGLGGSASYWAPNIPALAEHFRVIAYDHRGTGRSNRTLPDEVSIATMGEDLIALMDALEIEHTAVLGHALGGLIGLDVALTLNRIHSLVIVNGWSAWGGLDPHTARCFDVRLDLLHNVGPAAYLKAQPLFLYPASWISAHDAELLQESSPPACDVSPIENIERRIAALRAWQLWIDFGGASRTLVIGADDDMLVPVKACRELAETLAGGGDDARFISMPWGGHACNVTDPDTFNRIVLDFLRS